MVVRLALDSALLAAVMLTLGNRIVSFPLADMRSSRRLLLGLGTGLAVMTAAILSIVLCGAADVGLSSQSAVAAAIRAAGWMGFDLLGAAGEEVYGRGTVLLVAAAFFGGTGAPQGRKGRSKRAYRFDLRLDPGWSRRNDDGSVSLSPPIRELKDFDLSSGKRKAART